MTIRRALAWPLFLFWSLILPVMVVLVAVQPRDGRWWGGVAASVGGMVLYWPLRATARVRKVITIDRAIGEVYDFLSLPANQPRWNPRIGPAEPADVPVKLGQEWTFASKRRWPSTGGMK